MELSRAAQEGFALLKEGRAEAGIGAFESGLVDDPADRGCLLGVARAMVLQGKRSEARSFLERLVALEPTHNEARSHLAVDRYEQGDRGAVSQVRAAGRSSSAGLYELLNLGYVLSAEGDVDGAEDAFAQAADLEPQNALVELQAGEAALRRHDARSAVKHLTRATELRPAEHVPFALLTRAHLLAGNEAAASAALKQAQSVAAEAPSVQLELFRIQSTNGYWADAIQTADKLVAMQPENTEYLYFVGLALLRNGEPEPAASVLLEVVQKDPRYVDALHALSEAVELQGDLDRARELLEQALEVNPTASGPANDLANLYLIQSDGKPQAARVLRPVLAANPKDPISNFNYAVAIADEQPDVAAKHLQLSLLTTNETIRSSAERLLNTIMK